MSFCVIVLLLIETNSPSYSTFGCSLTLDFIRSRWWQSELDLFSATEVQKLTSIDNFCRLHSRTKIAELWNMPHHSPESHHMTKWSSRKSSGVGQYHHTHSPETLNCVSSSVLRVHVTCADLNVWVYRQWGLTGGLFVLLWSSASPNSMKLFMKTGYVVLGCLTSLVRGWMNNVTLDQLFPFHARNVSYCAFIVGVWTVTVTEGVCWQERYIPNYSGSW